MNDIFISYRRLYGEAWASNIKGLLEKRGVRCYFDKHKGPTKDFKEAIERNIEQSNNFLLILSENVFEYRTDDVDWVREEIAYARKFGKNIIAVMFNGYNPNNVNWNEDERISFLKTFECLKYDDTNMNLQNASIETIIQYMVDENNKPWKNSLKNNDNWYNGRITEEDRIWMKANMEVCKKFDLAAFKKIMEMDFFKNKKFINYFTFKAYDVDSVYERTFKYLRENNYDDKDKCLSVYGFCNSCDLERANSLFGDNHFLPLESSSNLNDLINEIKKINNVEYFDIFDLVLVLKDFEEPRKILEQVTEFLNPNGSAIYIRDLDDDLIVAYPDDNRLISKAIDLLSLDPGAGNRHLGKCIYTLLNRSGADQIHMINLNVETSSFNKVGMKRKICDAYFSYLIPEFKILVEKNPNNEDYIDGLHWLEQNYTKLESLFASKEFYFRSGFIGGYGIYKDDESTED